MPVPVTDFGLYCEDYFTEMPMRSSVLRYRMHLQSNWIWLRFVANVVDCRCYKAIICLRRSHPFVRSTSVLFLPMTWNKNENPSQHVITAVTQNWLYLTLIRTSMRPWKANDASKYYNRIWIANSSSLIHPEWQNDLCSLCNEFSTLWRNQLTEVVFANDHSMPPKWKWTNNCDTRSGKVNE